MSTLLVITGTAKSASVLISYGMCLGIGFWISKKITNKIDEKLCLYDKKMIDRLSKEMDLEHIQIGNKHARSD